VVESENSWHLTLIGIELYLQVVPFSSINRLEF